jgi:isopenicillin N synthase-like dioxygenase
MTDSYSLEELQRETTFGGAGEDTNDREIRIIDLSNFDHRREAITEQLWLAATEIGFFQLSHHGIPSEEINAAFIESERFFDLSETIRAQYPRPKGVNAGWESRSQIRPSTGTKDQKESYQITQYHMDNLWPSEEELPSFQANTLHFEKQCWDVGMKVLSCFADKLGFDRDFFSKAHDPKQTDSKAPCVYCIIFRPKA